MLSRHKDLSSVPNTHIERWASPAFGKQRQEDPWNLLASQSKQIGELAAVSLTDPVSKTYVGKKKDKVESKRKIPSASHWLLNAWVHTCSNTHTVKNIYKQDGIVMVYAMILEAGRKACKWSTGVGRNT